MLLPLVSRHDAPSRNPERESRLVMQRGGRGGRGGGGGRSGGNNPRENTDDNQEGGDRRRGDPVDQNRDRTRGQVDSTMTAENSKLHLESQSIAQRWGGIEEQMSDMMGEVDKILQDEHTPAIKLFKQNNSEAWARMRQTRVQFAQTLHIARGLKKRAELYAKWEQLDMSPQEFLGHVSTDTLDMQAVRDPKDHGGNSQDYEEMLLEERIAAARSFVRSTANTPRGGDGGMPNISDEDMWQNTSVAGKIMAIQQINRLLRMDERKAELRWTADTFEESIKQSELQKIIAAVGAAKQDVQQDPSLGGPAPVTRGGGVTWFSLHQLYLGFNDWKEAWTQAWDSADRYKGAIFAKKLGKMMKNIVPYGDAAQEQLDVNLEKKQDEEINGVLNKLKRQMPTFKQVFGPGGLLNASVGSPTTSLGVIKYAASRGWLYKINDIREKNNRTIFGHYKFDLLVPATWDDDQVTRTWDGILQENAQGESKEQNEAKEKVNKFTQPDQFLRAFDEEMGDCNFYAAMGIAESFIGRGKMGEASPRLAVAFLRHLRENDMVREYISDAIAERMPFPVWNKGYLTFANITMDRDNIRKWLNSGDKDIANAGGMGAAISEMEQYVRANSAGNISTRQMDTIVSQLFAAMTVPAPGTNKPLSIFDAPGLDKYRNFTAVTQYSKNFDVSKDEVDYYTSESDVLLGSTTFMNELFDVNTAGSGFVNAQKVQQFVGQMIFRYEQLHADPRTQRAAETFRQELAVKMSEAMERIANSTNTKPIAAMSWEWGKARAPLLASLRRYGFMSQKTFEKFSKESQKMMNEQLAVMSGTLTREKTQSDGQDAGAQQLGMAM